MSTSWALQLSSRCAMFERGWSGKLTRMTSCHGQPLRRADGGDGDGQGISVEASSVGIEHSRTNPVASFHLAAGRIDDACAGNVAYPFGIKADWPEMREMDILAVEPFQHPVQLCVLKSELPRQLIPEQADFAIQADYIVRNDRTAWRRLRIDSFLGLSAALSRCPFVNLQGLLCDVRSYIGPIGGGRISRFLERGAFDICRVINTACRLFGTIRGITLENWLLVCRTVYGV
ncbi:hypothetical protein HLI17_33695 [Rhizobium laguerreae]|uniref:Uncharacterized protein n=1 Tax=Rhizobium laguerreae TaxID=1076926 RepID=A0A7Y2W984_9HYPH|nr:hypothetical protein [Rhizobium laguerreae]